VATAVTDACPGTATFSGNRPSSGASWSVRAVPDAPANRLVVNHQRYRCSVEVAGWHWSMGRCDRYLASSSQNARGVTRRGKGAGLSHVIDVSVAHRRAASCGRNSLGVRNASARRLRPVANVEPEQEDAAATAARLLERQDTPVIDSPSLHRSAAGGRKLSGRPPDRRVNVPTSPRSRRAWTTGTWAATRARRSRTAISRVRRSLVRVRLERYLPVTRSQASLTAFLMFSQVD
jgi:hypothetical protein